MALARAQTTGGAILYDPSRVDPPAPEDFDPKALTQAGRVLDQARGRGTVWFVAARGEASPHQAWVLRHYRRGGFAARLSSDRYVWCGEAATRGFRELAILDYLAVTGVAAPLPVAARYLREGLTYRADLLTVAIPGATTLARLLQQSAGAPLPGATTQSVGRSIRRMHEAGVWHADLNAHNVLIDASGSVWLIDFDRAQRRSPGPWGAQNLARLRRSLDKLASQFGQPLPAADWASLLAGYGGE